MHDIRKRRLNQHLSPWKPAYFLTLILPDQLASDNNITKCALLIYAIYRTHNYLTHLDHNITDYDNIFDTATQYLYEGTFGHQKATATLDNAFSHKRKGNKQLKDKTNPLYIDNHLDSLPPDIDICDLT